MQSDTEVCRRPIDQEVRAISRGKLVKARTTRSIPSKRKKRRRRQARAPPDNPDAYSIGEFCWRHSISRPTYNRLRASGRGPREIKLDQRVLITKEAAADWRHEREAATAAAQAATE
jgi:hypothetical protein